MFEDKYKKELEDIKADGYIKQKTLMRMEYEKNKKRPVNKMTLRASIAFACVAVLVVSVFAINRINKVDIPTVTPSGENVPTKTTYDSIYDKIKGLSKIQARDDAVYIAEEYAADEEVGLYSEATNDTAKPNATKGNSSTNATTTDKNKAEGETEVSNTNEQVKGVAEADIVKTDGKYIYVYSQKKNEISIVKAGKEAEKVSSIKLDGNAYYFSNEMFVQNGRLIFLTRETEESQKEKGSKILTDDRIYVGGKGYTAAMIYNVENPENPEKLYQCMQSGDYNTSRLIGNTLYLVSNYYIDTYNVKKNDCATYVPVVTTNDVERTVSADSICIAKEVKSPVYTVICAYSIENGKMLGTQSVLGGTDTVYCSNENIITASYSNGVNTKITRYSFNDGNIKYEAEAEIKGTLLNQFSIDEHNGYFRFVTTENTGVETRDDRVVYYTMSTVNSLRILDGDLKEIGKIENIAPDERVYSVRFMGDVAYFVTFRQVDPLFSVDLSNPKEPKIIGALKIPGFSNYLFPFGEGKLLGIGQDADEKTGKTGGIKFSIFDTGNPANVTESAKTVLKYRDSDALYNHKASLVDTKRNLIGISVWWEGKMQYNLYSYKNGGFETVIEFVFDEYSDFIRGLYIGEEFYVVTDSAVLVHNLNTFEKITTVEL